MLACFVWVEQKERHQLPSLSQLKRTKKQNKKSCNIEQKILKKKKKCCLCIKVKQDKTKEKKKEENLIVVAKQKVGLWIKP